MSFVATHDDGRVRWLTMSAPATKNAIPKDGWVELADAFEAFEASVQRVLVVTGDGEDFSAGADLGADFSGFGTAAANAAYMRLPNRAALALHRIS
jgi:enoyl-CoA hydratase/carnithine racemase